MSMLVMTMICLSEMSAGQEVKFVLPLKGELGKDFFITNYADHDATKGIQDVFCGNRTFDGHQGTDFSIRSFKSMDSGVYVCAAADGRVYEVRDDDNDHDKKSGYEGYGNKVGIIHLQQICTHYSHLKMNSLLVKMGDSVKAGQPIGMVGCSGYSWTPHLHFEVRDKEGNVIDPFLGDCSMKNISYWISQPKYETSILILNSGFVPYVPKYDSLTRGILVSDTFDIQKDTTVCFWVNVYGLHGTDRIHVDFYNPIGLLNSDVAYKGSEHWFEEYYWAYFKAPRRKGKWTAKFFVNDKLITSRNFYVTSGVK